MKRSMNWRDLSRMTTRAQVTTVHRRCTSPLPWRKFKTQIRQSWKRKRKKETVCENRQNVSTVYTWDYGLDGSHHPLSYYRLLVLLNPPRDSCIYEYMTVEIDLARQHPPRQYIDRFYQTTPCPWMVCDNVCVCVCVWSVGVFVHLRERERERKQGDNQVSRVCVCVVFCVFRVFVMSVVCWWFYYIRIKKVFYYETINNGQLYECRCDERLQTKTERSTRLTYTGFRGGLEHLKIESRLIDERLRVWWVYLRVSVSSWH
jgi:hypothetical protein